MRFCRGLVNETCIKALRTLDGFERLRTGKCRRPKRIPLERE